ncbi:MAG: sugar-binding protein [Armatimonadota bacterium]
MRGVYACLFFGLLPLVGGGLSAQQTMTEGVRIYDTVYEKVDPGAPFVEAPRTLEDWQPAEPTAAERSAGFIPFTRGEPFDIKPWSKPKPSERVKELRARMALGETTSLWFAVYALEPLEQVTMTLSKPKEPLSFDVRYAHFWAQRTDWRGRTYYVTPELLLQMRDGRAQFPAKGGTLQWRSLNVPQAECRLFWVNVTASARCRPGEYTAHITVRAHGKQSLVLPLRVYVYPFRLQKPSDKRWLLYSDSWVLGNLPDDKLSSVLRNVAQYGIDGLTELPFGHLDISKLAEGKVGYDPQPLLRWRRLMEQAGLRGPHTIGTFVEDQVPGRLGIQADINREWDERLRNSMRLIAQTVVRTLEPYRMDWLFYGWDEPGPDNVRAVEQYRAWREGGAQTYVTFYQRGTYDVAAQWMTHPCFSTGLIASQQTAQWAYEQCRARGQKFFWYGSGCYLGQEGRMFPNRFLAGWLFWKTKADGQVSWTFVRPHEDPFNDFDGVAANSVEPKDQCTVYPELAVPNSYASILGIIPTIQWEALREGINDYLYLATLRNTIAYARKVARSPKGNQWRLGLLQVADECERTLRAVEESVPWLNEVGRAGYTNAKLQEARTIVGASLERLVRYLRGEPTAPPQRTSSITLRVRVVSPVSHPVSTGYTPILTIPRWEQLPVIDGRLSEPQWEIAGAAVSFWESQSGVPIPHALHTEAKLAFDERALYIGFECHAPRPERLHVERIGRDADSIWLDESVEIFLASPDAPERYAHFIINPRAAVYDELVLDTSWNAEIDVKTRTTAQGWTLEMAIPWTSLPFEVDLGRTGQPFLRLNLGRNHREVGGSVSHWVWSPTFGWFHNPHVSAWR